MSLVVINDTRIVQMISDPRFQAEIPCLANASKITHQMVKKQKARCKSCGGRKRKQSVAATAAAAGPDAGEVLTTVKRCIKALPWTKKNKLKQLLGASKVRIHVPVSDRKVVTITF
jgi:hypothetical protein